MPSGRVDRERRRRRGESSAGRRFERARKGETSAAESGRGGKRPAGQSAARPRARGTGGAFKLSSTRRASVLAILVCAMALSVSVPLRTYLSQRDELAAQRQREAELSKQVGELGQRKDELSDPVHVEAEARRRLGYVRPGETPFIVQVPNAPTGVAPPPPPAPRAAPWYSELWKSVTGGDS